MLNQSSGNNYGDLLERLVGIRDEISGLISQGIKNPSVRYKNNHLVKCWEVKNCGKRDCSSYDSQNLRCWQVAGTYCEGEIQGDFAQKYEDCKKCEVFKTACASELDYIGEGFNNLIHLLQQERKKVDSLNKELANTLNTLGIKKNKVLRLTLIDNLTGLYNRNYLFQRLDNELERIRRYDCPLSLFIIDIDGFRNYNNAFGYREGDILLKKTGEIIKKSIRMTDFACRFGGDEFIVVLPETEQKVALVAAERVREGVKAYSFYPNQETRKASPVNKTASIGVYTVTNNNNTIENLIECADEAMYKAKEKGGDKVIFSAPKSK